jgi:hypothetical protein
MAIRLLVLFALLTAASCGAPPVLYTDEFFRVAAPEVVRAWKSPGWFRSTQTVDLPSGGGLAALRQAIDLGTPSPSVLVGMNLSQAERRQLAVQYPAIRWRFLTASRGDDSGTTISVNRAETWALVARAEAGRFTAGESTLALFPSDATSDEIRTWEEAWKSAGGGPYTTATGPRPTMPTPLPQQVFQWAGAEGEPLVLALPPSVVVHGHPGTVRAPGAEGTTWRLRESDLAGFLWDVAQDPSPEARALPVETTFEES